MKADPTEQLRHSWEANAGAWVEAVQGGAIPSRRLATDAAILRAALAGSPRSALDLGCGEGWLTRALAERGVDVVGVDASARLVDAARLRGGARFEVCSYAGLVEDPGRLAGPFGVVVCNFSLLEKDLEALLTGVRRRLDPRGRLLVQTVHPWTASGGADYRDGWRTEDFAGMGGGFAEAMPWYFRTLESWSHLLSGSGYTLSGVEEPRHPETGQPLSLLLVARPVP